jgi:hypothetical protein
VRSAVSKVEGPEYLSELEYVATVLIIDIFNPNSFVTVLPRPHLDFVTC